MRQFRFEHQGKKIAADGAGAGQAVVRPQNNLGGEPENLALDRRTNNRRDIFMFGNKGARDDDVKTGFAAALGNALARTVDLSSSHERACSAISARVWRARRLRCFLKMTPSFASAALCRCLSAYWRTAVRTNAAWLRRGVDAWVNLSRSLRVDSSIAIVFMSAIIATVAARAQVWRDLLSARVKGALG